MTLPEAFQKVKRFVQKFKSEFFNPCTVRIDMFL